jgi:hypothetical protein
MDREPGEVLSLAEPDPAYDLALATVASEGSGVPASNSTQRSTAGFRGLVRRVLGRRNGG